VAVMETLQLLRRNIRVADCVTRANIERWP